MVFHASDANRLCWEGSKHSQLLITPHCTASTAFARKQHTGLVGELRKHVQTLQKSKLLMCVYMHFNPSLAVVKCISVIRCCVLLLLLCRAFRQTKNSSVVRKSAGDLLTALFSLEGIHECTATTYCILQCIHIVAMIIFISAVVHHRHGVLMRRNLVLFTNQTINIHVFAQRLYRKCV